MVFILVLMIFGNPSTTPSITNAILRSQEECETAGKAWVEKQNPAQYRYTCLRAR